jgi:hypothetical protein
MPPSFPASDPLFLITPLRDGFCQNIKAASPVLGWILCVHFDLGIFAVRWQGLLRPRQPIAQRTQPRAEHAHKGHTPASLSTMLALANMSCAASAVLGGAATARVSRRSSSTMVPAAVRLQSPMGLGVGRARVVRVEAARSGANGKKMSKKKMSKMKQVRVRVGDD